MIVILSLLLEHVFAIVFEWARWREWLAQKKLGAPIAFGGFLYDLHIF